MRAVRRRRAGREVQPAAHQRAVDEASGARLRRIFRRGGGGFRGVVPPGGHYGRRQLRADRDLCQPAGEHRGRGCRGPGGSTASVTTGRTFYQVPVAEVIGETDQACSIAFDVPAELAQYFAYRPGQFLTLRVPTAEGASVARGCSLGSPPAAGEPLRIGVKQMPSGIASTWTADNATAGTVLDVLPPAGTFTPR